MRITNLVLQRGIGFLGIPVTPLLADDRLAVQSEVIQFPNF